MIDENEFEINIKIDNGLTAVVKVKKNMDALEFMGITQKAKQLFNLGNKEIVYEQKERKERKTYTIKGWTPELIARLEEVWGTMPIAKIAELPEFGGRTKSSIYAKAFSEKIVDRYRAGGNISTRGPKSKPELSATELNAARDIYKKQPEIKMESKVGSSFTPAEDVYITQLVQKGLKTTAIADKMGVKKDDKRMRKRIENKIKRMRG
jgi:hypothetical protein